MKGFITGILVFLAGLTLYGQENGFTAALPAALPVGFWPEERRVTEMQVVHDLDGGVYIPYIADREFRVLKMGRDEEPRLYDPEGFESPGISVRNLKLMTGEPEQYTAFIGKKDGNDGLYIFGVTHRGEYSCYFAEERFGAASIFDYSLGCSPEGEVLVSILAGGRLYLLTGPGREDRPWTREEISSPSEQVDAFDFFYGMGGINYGWYRNFYDDQWEITLFSVGTQGRLIREKTGGSSATSRLDCRIFPTGISVFTLCRDRDIVLYQGKDGAFTKYLHFTAPVKVLQYRSVFGTGASMGLLIGQANGEELLYAVTRESSGVPVLKLLYSLPPGELLDIFITDDNRISLLYCREEAWRNALISSDGVLIKDNRLQIPGKPVRILYTGGNESPELYVLSVISGSAGQKNSVSAILVHCRFESAAGAWIVLQEPAISAALPGSDWHPTEIPALNPFYTEAKVIAAVSPEALAFFQTESGENQFLEKQSHAWSIRLNGVIYLATWAKNRVRLYRMEE
ncbi:hypothetical protein TREPR_1399 [Treponema primitia ZAS-2]|uniref:Uncharacterized protein n=1 Tax=Treponema primitia (strain ATCC BAA-887 / DSM 12427 / ZAS-2) TaxID=545694 RepID=F5YQP2_TREPZ|nr:hypothetical protein [Treponema primitia]AEF85239.1 hypothetical protein TREPR_1399 [Treponema primitia ZAS-2]